MSSDADQPGLNLLRKGRKLLSLALTLYCGYHLVLGGAMLVALVLVELDWIDGRCLTLRVFGKRLDGNDEGARSVLFEMAGRSFLLGLGRFVLLGCANGTTKAPTLSEGLGPA